MEKLWYDLSKKKQIVVAPYDPIWPELFQQEKERVEAALGKKCVAMHHVGSTSVPGLDAKPLIDCIAVVKDLADLDEPLAEIGYRYKGEYNLPMRRLYGKKEPYEVHLHVHLEGSAEIELNLLFRDALREDAELRESYATLKKEGAAVAPVEGRTGTGVSAYNLHKNAFICEVLNKQGFDGLCLRLCTQKEEWDAYHQFRRTLLFKPSGVGYDPNHPSMTDPANKHLVFVKGTHVVAAGQIEWRGAETVILRTMAVDESFQRQGIGTKLMQKIEQWVLFQGAKEIYTNAATAAMDFYKKQGYTNSAFDDENPMPNTTQMGKRAEENGLSLH